MGKGRGGLPTTLVRAGNSSLRGKRKERGKAEGNREESRAGNEGGLETPPRLPTGMGIGWLSVLLFALPSLVGPVPSEPRYFLPDFVICYFLLMAATKPDPARILPLLGEGAGILGLAATLPLAGTVPLCPRARPSWERAGVLVQDSLRRSGREEEPKKSAYHSQKRVSGLPSSVSFCFSSLPTFF
jgi:hypothetical protein